MHALAYPSDTDVPAHRSQGFGRIGHSEPNTLQIPRSVVALPRRGADATRSSSLALAAAARRQRALLWQRLFSRGQGAARSWYAAGSARCTTSTALRCATSA
jgi:hypothetical protein